MSGPLETRSEPGLGPSTHAALLSRKEVTLLNDELRRQIAERSRQLAEALGRIGDVSPLATSFTGDLAAIWRRSSSLSKVTSLRLSSAA